MPRGSHGPVPLKKFRLLADEVSALVRQFKGSIAGEHGVGIARTEYLREHLGDPLLQAMREIKSAFDPLHRFNPGKIIGDDRFTIDSLLRADSHRDFTPPPHRILGSIDRLAQIGCLAPTLANALLKATGFRLLLARGLGLSARRPLPPYTRERFDHWFHRQPHPRSARFHRHPRSLPCQGSGPSLLHDSTR